MFDPEALEQLLGSKKKEDSSYDPFERFDIDPTRFMLDTAMMFELLRNDTLNGVNHLTNFIFEVLAPENKMHLFGLIEMSIYMTGKNFVVSGSVANTRFDLDEGFIPKSTYNGIMAFFFLTISKFSDSNPTVHRVVDFYKLTDYLEMVAFYKEIFPDANFPETKEKLLEVISK